MSKNRASFIPNYIINTSKFLSATSPFLAKKFAIKLFSTPVKFKTPSSEKAFISASKAKPLFFENSNNFIHTLTYGTGKKKILLVHGWSGRGSQLARFAKGLEDSFTFYTFDAPRHGNSNGKDTNLKRFIESIELMNETFGPFDYAIGHSLGSMAILNAASRGVGFQKIILIGSGNKISDIALDFVDKIKLPASYGVALKEHFDKKFQEDVNNYSSENAAKNVDVPVLLIHDEEDLEVPVSSSYEIRQNLVNSKIITTKGLGHTKILRDKGVISQVYNFINHDS